MHPVLGCLTDKSTLITSCASISLHRMTSSTHEVIELREFNNKSIPIVLVEWTFLEVLLDEGRFELKFSLFLVT